MAFVFSQDYRARVLALPQILRRRGGQEGLAGNRPGGRVEFRDHRPYVPGDDLRDLDWHLFLRLDELVVKEYGKEEAPEVLLVLDRSGSMGPPRSGKDRIAREVAGALAYVALAAGCAVTFAVPGEGGPIYLGKFRSARRLDAVLSLLEELGDPGGPTWLVGLRHLPPTGLRGRATFLISDFLVEPLPIASLLALGQGGGRGALLHLVSASERELALPSASTASDPETGATVWVEDAATLLRDYALELAAHEEAMLQLANRHALALARFTDDAPFETAVLHAVAGRGARA